MILNSPMFSENEVIPFQFTCDGNNVNPPLAIDEVPEISQSLVLIMEDPDAPQQPFYHWIVWNLPPDARYIKEESVPPTAIEGNNSSGALGYTGPCPPSGTHHYYFRLFALDNLLDLQEGASAVEVEKQMSGHILDETTLIGIYTSE